jgi:hypothetical protein
MVAECIWRLGRSDRVSFSFVRYHDEGTHRATEPFLPLIAVVSRTFCYRSLASVCCAAQYSRCVLGSIECSDHRQELG